MPLHLKKFWTSTYSLIFFLAMPLGISLKTCNGGTNLKIQAMPWQNGISSSLVQVVGQPVVHPFPNFQILKAHILFICVFQP